LKIGSIVKVRPRVGHKDEQDRIGIVIDIERPKDSLSAFFKEVFVIQWNNDAVSKCSMHALEEVYLEN